MLCFVEKFRILFSKLTASKAICTLMYVLISCTVVFKYQLIVGKCSHLLPLGVFASGGLTYFFCKVKIPHFQRSFAFCRNQRPFVQNLAFVLYF